MDVSVMDTTFTSWSHAVVMCSIHYHWLRMATYGILLLASRSSHTTDLMSPRGASLYLDYKRTPTA